MKQNHLIPIFLFLYLLASQVEARTDKYRCIWRDDPSTTVTIAWNQVSGGQAVVYYDEVDFGQEYRNYAYSAKPHHSVVAKGMNNFFVRLADLRPSTTYYFLIKDSDGTSRRMYFTTVPDHPYERLSIIAGGDSRNNRTSRKNANLIVAKLKPHVVLFGGDMTGGDNKTQWPQWMDDWQLTIAQDGRMTPIVPARGNHEYSNQTLIDLFDAPNKNIYYSLGFGGNLLRSYTLNSMMSAGGTQAEWLESELTKYEDYVWKFAQYHHPIRPHTAKKRNREQQRTSWASLFYKHNVDVVVECDGHVVKSTWPIRPTSEPGHDQGFVRDDQNGTVYVGEGCWGAPIRPNNHDKEWTRASGSFNQFKWIFVDMERVEIRTIKTDNAKEVGEVAPYDIFTPPANLDIWNPRNGEVIYIHNQNYIPSPIVRTPVAPPPPKPKDINVIKGFDLNLNEEQLEMEFSVINESKDVTVEIQRSMNGEYFSTIDTLLLEKASKDARSFKSKDFRAPYLNASELYYRIKITKATEDPDYTIVKKIELTPWSNYEETKIDPVTKIFRLKYEIEQPEDVYLSIYSGKGREEKIKRFTAQPEGEYTRLIDLKGFSPGVYLLKINFSKQKNIIKRLVVPEIGE